MLDLVRDAPGLRAAVLVGGAVLVGWGAGALAPARPSPGLIGALLERVGAAASRGPLRRRGLDLDIRRGLALGAVPWLQELAAGDPERALRVVVGVRLCLVLPGLLATVAGLTGAGPAAALLGVGVGVGSALALDVGIALAVRTMQHRVAEQLPLATELMGIALGAGQSLERALSSVAAEVEHPLRAVLQRTGARIATGAAAGEALRDEAARTAVAGLARAAAAIERGMALGLAMGPPLHTLAGELRAAQRSALLARAGRATPLAALVTAVVIAPACVGALLVCLIGAVALPGGVLG